MASKITQEYRKSVADMFIKCLEEETRDWKKNWAGLGTPVNFSSHAQYKGVNKFYLTVVMMKHGWEDNRFMTFNQIKAKGLKLKAGSHGAKVEYWMPFDVKQKKALNWKEYKELIKGMPDDEIENRFGLTAKYYTVFNGTMIEGLPEFKLEKNMDIEPDQVIEQISKGMGVEILHDGGDRAFYRGSEDKIHLPVPGAFNTSYDYNCTALHELGHATGAAHRLNRDMGGGFGSKEYAREELVAEITSAFMGVYLGDNSKATEQDFNNHKAYVQDWISAIKEKPETLFNAIKQAEAAADYMEKAGDLVKEKVVSLEEIKEKRGEKKSTVEGVKEQEPEEMEMWC